VLNDCEFAIREDEVVADKEKSWERIFEVDVKRGCLNIEGADPEYVGAKGPLQATMWFIDPSWVRSFKEL
jgi:hypothetical protein